VSELLASLLSPDERRAVTEFTKRVYQHFPGRIEQMALFGSKARGDSRPWSDIDILIVADNGDWRFQHAISTLASRVSLEYDVLISPRVIEQERWDRMKRRRFGLYQNVIAESIPLTSVSTHP
jgi:predicted nucleotidyltransferase